MSERCEVVVIGGGVIGTSCAYHLARRGIADVVVLEREKFLGTGATSKAAGGIRAQFSTEINIRLSLLAIRAFERMEDELGTSIEYHQYGYLFLADRSEHAAVFRANAAMQRSLGVPVDILEPGVIAERWPWIRCDDLVVGAYCGIDGQADPHGVTMGYEQGARRLGARILSERRVTGIRVERGGVVGVDTDAGPIACNWVVDAAGPEADVVAAMAGVQIPARPYRRHLFVTEQFPAIPDGVPLTVDFGSGFYCRKETGTVMMGLANKDEPPGLNQTVDPDFMAVVAEAGFHRIPVLEDATIFKGWAGCYSVTPDHHPILGVAPGCKGLVLACGFSGHGFMHAPATGLLVGEIIADGRAHTVDVDCLSLERFDHGELIHEFNVI